MPLTLDDIIAAPSDPVALNQHLQQRGLIPLAPPPAPGLPATTVASMTPPVIKPAVAPMAPPAVHAERAETSPLAPRAASLAIGATAQPELPANKVAPMTPPEITGPAAPASGIPELTAPKMPTPQESIAAGIAEHGGTPKEEGERQFKELRPVVTAPPNSSEFWQQKIAQEEFDKAHPLGGDISAHPGTGGKILHTLGKIGEIAGGIVAPGVMANIPGTRLNRAIREEGEAAEQGKAATRESEEALRGAQTEEAKQRTEEEKTKLTKEQSEQSLEKDAQGNVTGWKGPDGKLHSLDEEGTPQAIKDIAEASKSKQGPQLEKTANGDIVQITTDKDGKATSQVVYHGDPKVETDLTSKTIDGQEHRILVNKSNGEMIKDLGAFKTEQSPAAALKQEQADEEPVIGFDKDGTQRLMSRAEAKSSGLSHMIKATPKDREDAEQNASALNDMTAKVRNLRDSSKNVDKLGAVQKTLIQTALRGAPDDYTTRFAVSQMSQEAKEFYQDVTSLREAALALPKQTTGGARVSEVQAHALWSTIPGAAGDHAFREGQLRKFDENTERLWRKVPMVEGNKRERAFGENEGGGAKQTVKISGKEYPLNPDGTVEVNGHSYKATPGSKTLTLVK